MLCFELSSAAACVPRRNAIKVKIESAAVSVQANGLHLYSVFRNIQISSINIWQNNILIPLDYLCSIILIENFYESVRKTIDACKSLACSVSYYFECRYFTTTTTSTMEIKKNCGGK